MGIRAGDAAKMLGDCGGVAVGGGGGAGGCDDEYDGVMTHVIVKLKLIVVVLCVPLSNPLPPTA